MAVIQNFFDLQKESKKNESSLGKAADFFDKYSPVNIASNLLVKPIVKTAAKPFGEFVSSAYELTGNEAPAWTRGNRMASPEILATLYGSGKSASEIKQKSEQLKRQGYEGAGFTDALNVASLIPAGGALKAGGIFSRAATALEGSVARRAGAGFLSNATRTAVELAPASAVWGAAYGAASGLDERDSAGTVLGKTLLGGAAGLAVAGAGGILGAGASALTRSKPERILARESMIINKRNEELTGLVSKNNKLSSIVETAKRNGNDILPKIAESDLLVGSVSRDGAISTRGAGEAVSKVDTILDNVDSTIYDNIVREGSTAPIDDVERALVQNVEESGLVFAQKEAALRRVRKEVNAMRKQAVNGVVPLSDIQKAKIQIKPNYLDPEKGTVDKIFRNAYKKYIENNITSVDVQAANKELGELYAIRELVDSLHGKRVKGGRLGKYFAQTIGAIAGSKGGPLGSIVGAEVAGNIQERMLASRFGNATGKEITAGEYLTKAAQQGKSPRLALPAPEGKPTGPRVYEPGVMQMSEATTYEPRARIVGSAPIEQPKQAAIGYQGEGGFTGKPIPMGAPTTYEPRANIVGSTKLTLDDIVMPKVSDDVQEVIAKLKTVEDFDNEITKRVERFRQEAGLMAEREGAGVKYRNVEDAVGDVNFVAKDFSLAKAKATMKRQADSLKKYAQEMLYENDADFRAIVDAQDALMESRIIDVKATDNSKMLDNVMDWLDGNIKKTESALKDTDYIEASKFYSENSKGNMRGSSFGSPKDEGRYTAKLTGGVDAMKNSSNDIASSIQKAKASGQSFDEWVKGQGEPLYHGTNRNFDSFDIKKQREIRNRELGAGEGIYFSPRKDVAEKYAGASANANFDINVIDEVSKKYPNSASFLKELVEKGDNAWKNKKLLGLVEQEGIDANLLSDISEYISGSKTYKIESARDEIMRMLGSGEQTLDIPNYIIEKAKRIGIAEPKRQVKEVFISPDAKIFETADRVAAQSVKGYDVIKIIDKKGVDSVPEYLVKNPDILKTRSQLKAEWDKVGTMKGTKK